MESELQFRLSKSGQKLAKTKKYKIKINGDLIGEIDYQNYKLSQLLPTGKYSIEVGEEEYFVKKEIILHTGQMQTLTISPSLTVPFIRGFLIGIVIVTIITQFVILDKISIPLILIPIVPILLFKKRHYAESFVLTKSNTVFK